MPRNSANGGSPRKLCCNRAATSKRDLRHRVMQYAKHHRVALGVIRVLEKAFPVMPAGPPGPASIPGSPHPAHRSWGPAHRRGVHVSGVARQQHASGALSGSLTRHVTHTGDPGRTVKISRVGPLDADQRFADITQCGVRCRGRSWGSVSTMRAFPPSPLPNPMDAGGILLHPPLRLLRPSRPRRSASSS